MNEVTHCKSKHMTVIVAKLNTTWAASLALIYCKQAQALAPVNMSSLCKMITAGLYFSGYVKTIRNLISWVVHRLWFFEPWDLQSRSGLRSIMNKNINAYTQVTWLLSGFVESNYTILQNKRMRRCGLHPPPIIFERLKLPQQITYRKGNLSESPNHQKYWRNTLMSRFYEHISPSSRNLGHFWKFEKSSDS